MSTAEHYDFPQKDLPPTTVFLRPIAAPSILGLYGFAGATFMVGAFMADWYGGTRTAQNLAPFAAFFGGLAQFLAGMWAYRARDGLATAMHGMWGSFWMAWGLLMILLAGGVIAMPISAPYQITTYQAFGYWFIVLAAITWAGAVAAMAVSIPFLSVLVLLASGSTLAAIGYLTASTTIIDISGYCFLLSALAAFYQATGLMLRESFGKEMIPLFEFEQEKRKLAMNVGLGEPGVQRGQ